MSGEVGWRRVCKGQEEPTVQETESSLGLSLSELHSNQETNADTSRVRCGRAAEAHSRRLLAEDRPQFPHLEDMVNPSASTNPTAGLVG